MTLSAHQQSLVDDFSIIEDSQERLSAVIDRARRLPALPEDLRIESNRITGCQSQVWLVADFEGEGLLFKGDSDSPLVRGLVALTCDFFSHEPVEKVVAEADVDPLALLGLAKNLSATRQNGLAAVRARIRDLAKESGGS